MSSPISIHRPPTPLRSPPCTPLPSPPIVTSLTPKFPFVFQGRVSLIPHWPPVQSTHLHSHAGCCSFVRGSSTINSPAKLSLQSVCGMLLIYYPTIVSWCPWKSNTAHANVSVLDRGIVSVHPLEDRPLRGGIYWEKRGLRDFPRAGILHLEAREGDKVLNAFRIEAVNGHSLSISSYVLILTQTHRPRDVFPDISLGMD